jgi:outer membrane lipoprotein-sorting protein
MNQARLPVLWAAAGAALLFLVAPAAAQRQPDPQALLVASDAIRNPTQPFRVTVNLIEFEKGQQVDATTLTSYARTLEAGGQFATLVHFVEPARDAGKLMLKNGKDLWFYDPSTKSSVRISPQQRLMGEASNGDVITVSFARDYKAEYGAEEVVTDGERKPRKAHKLLLTAANDDATYASIELWVDAENRRPIKAHFLADSGRLLKMAFYRRFQSQLGAERPTETVIIDGINPQQVTLVRLSNFAARNIPTTWFQRDYLPRFQGD